MTTLGDGLAAPLVRRHAGRLTRSLSENSPSAQPWLWLALAAFLAMALAYMAAVPSFEGFDVQAHYAAVNYYRSERSAPALASETLETSYELITQPPLYYVLAAMAAAGWPVEPAQEYAERSVNAYFGSDVTYRQSVTVPPEHAADAVPALLARLVSLLGGLLVALATWWTARLVLPASPLFAAAAVAVATLNPLFLFQSVTITNDTWAAAVAAIALAIALEGWLGERSPRWWFAAGAALGLCALTKYSALLVAVPSSVAWIMYQRRAGRRLGGAALAWAVAGFGLFGGWWLFRSVMLHGELVPFRTMGAVIQSLYRTHPLTVGQTLGYLPWLVSSFWGVFVALIAPAAYLQVTRWFMVLGLASAPIAVLRARHALSRTAASVNAVLMLWLAVVILGVLHWTRTVNIGEQAARLGLVGASAFGVLMVGGYASWIPARHRPRAYATIFVLMTGLGLWLLPFLYQAYRLPPAVAEGHVPERAVPAWFGPGMRILGVDFPDGAALDPAGKMPVTLYMTTDAPISVDYTMFLHLSDADDRLLFSYDGAPVEGRHPTRQWVPGVVFADTYEIGTSAPVTSGLVAWLSAGFYPFEQPDARLEARDGQGQPAGDRVLLGRVRVDSKAPTAAGGLPAEPIAMWSNGIALAAADVDRDAEGAPIGASLSWTTEAAIDADYTVFVQVLDQSDGILAQRDREPRHGRWPTSTWRAGDVITDAFVWEADVTRWQRVIIGFYDADGHRLPLTSPPDSPADALELLVRTDA